MFSVAAGLKANGPTPMKDGLLMALREIGENGKIITPLRNFIVFLIEVISIGDEKLQSQL